MNITHLQENNVTYFQHMKRSLKYSFRSLRASCVFLIHGCFPFCFEYDGGQIIHDINLNISHTH